MAPEISQVSAAQAVAVMRAVKHMADPSNMDTLESIAGNGECFRFAVGESEGVFVVKKKGCHLWVSAAAALASAGLAKIGMQAMDAIAVQAQCRTVGFQTARAGLVRLAKKQGYRVTGFIMEKRI